MFRLFVAVLAAVAQQPALPPPSDEPPTDVGGAKPINPRAWFTADDFPTSAVAAHHRGVVYVSVTIGTDGRISECHVVHSSGYADLDAVPCPLLERRANFQPAQDQQGQLREATGTIPIPFNMMD